MREANAAEKLSQVDAVPELIRRPIAPVRSWCENAAYAGLLVAIDCVAILLAFVAAFFFRTAVLPNFDARLSEFVPVEPYLEAPWLILLWPAVFCYNGLYDRGLGSWDEQVRLLQGICFGGILAMGATFVFHVAPEYSRVVLIGTSLAAFFFIPVLRAYFKSRFLLRAFPIRILLLTAREAGREMDSAKTVFAKLGYQVLKIVPIETEKEETELRNTIHNAIAALDGAEIVLDGRGLSEEVFRKVLRCVESAGVRVRVISTFSIFQLRANVRNLDGLILFDLNGGLARPFSRFIKRTMDVTIAAVLLILLAPLFVILGILIKLDSPGPIFYRHRRLDARGRAFRCWKFRTMYRDAEQRLRHWMQTDDVRAKEFQARFKLKDDPRMTGIGKTLRRTSLDELPQLLNVLKGEMSLVGPRPIVPEEVAKYGNDFQYLLMAKGGMTGIWQVSGRNDIDYTERIALDSFYVRNWSIWADIVILFKTLRVVITKSGAY